MCVGQEADGEFMLAFSNSMDAALFCLKVSCLSSPVLARGSAAAVKNRLQQWPLSGHLAAPTNLCMHNGWVPHLPPPIVHHACICCMCFSIIHSPAVHLVIAKVPTWWLDQNSAIMHYMRSVHAGDESLCWSAGPGGSIGCCLGPGRAGTARLCCWPWRSGESPSKVMNRTLKPAAGGPKSTAWQLSP